LEKEQPTCPRFARSFTALHQLMDTEQRLPAPRQVTVKEQHA
jgi:hypothetical protein